MKVRLLENVTHHGLNGCVGQVLDLPKDVAEDLERHGHATFDLAAEEVPAVTELEAKAIEEEHESVTKKAKKAHK
jgi:hypothetical protein